ncbi:MAG: DUF6054 family protein [Firmicutes bacterium]|nr:DUF6054 family protein [Bacillota bacterium]
MAILEFTVNISPIETYNILNDEVNAELVHREIKNIDDGKQFVVMVFEKYYFRAENRAALTIIIDNFDGITSLRVIAAGSSKGWLFNFDWGAAESFANSVRKALEKFIV